MCTSGVSFTFLAVTNKWNFPAHLCFSFRLKFFSAPKLAGALKTFDERKDRQRMTANILKVLERFAKAGDGSDDLTDEQKLILDNLSPGDTIELREWLQSASQYLNNFDESAAPAPDSHSLSVMVPEGIVSQVSRYQKKWTQRVYPSRRSKQRRESLVPWPWPFPPGVALDPEIGSAIPTRSKRVDMKYRN